MHRVRLRTSVAALACALALLVVPASGALAQSNNQSGLVNVNLQELQLVVPVSVSVPVGVALNACGVNILAVQQADNNCTATNNSVALSQAIADAMLGTGGNGGANNNQSGLVNVNIQGLQLVVPVSVALPVGVAANVCGVSVLSLQQGNNTCNAQNTSQALSAALARAIAA